MELLVFTAIAQEYDWPPTKVADLGGRTSIPAVVESGVSSVTDNNHIRIAGVHVSFLEDGRKTTDPYDELDALYIRSGDIVVAW